MLSFGRCGDPFGDHPTRGASQVGFLKNERINPIILKDTILQTETKSGMGHVVFPYGMPVNAVQTLCRLPCAQNKLYLRSHIYRNSPNPASKQLIHTAKSRYR